MSGQKPKRIKVADLSRCRRSYFMELARASSFISSTRYPATRAAMIDEVVAGFSRLYGDADLRAFVELLIERLTEREDPAAAAEVQLRHGDGGTPAQRPEPVAPPVANSRSARLRRAA